MIPHPLQYLERQTGHPDSFPIKEDENGKDVGFEEDGAKLVKHWENVNFQLTSHTYLSKPPYGNGPNENKFRIRERCLNQPSIKDV